MMDNDSGCYTVEEAINLFQKMIDSIKRNLIDFPETNNIRIKAEIIDNNGRPRNGGVISFNIAGFNIVVS